MYSYTVGCGFLHTAWSGICNLYAVLLSDRRLKGSSRDSWISCVSWCGKNNHHALYSVQGHWKVFVSFIQLHLW